MTNVRVENTFQEEGILYPKFYDNLGRFLDSTEFDSLKVLGKSFFDLIDNTVSELLKTRIGQDHLFLDLSLEEYLWELQVFVYKYFRSKCSNVLYIKLYCDNLTRNLENKIFRDEFIYQLEKKYEEYFFIDNNNKSYLV